MKKVLIANRGEIAVRIIRACADYGVKSVAIYADEDSNALHVGMADEAYALVGVTPTESYLNIDKIIAVAKRSGADAIHPGYGFLSESAEFAQAVIDAGLIWIGPTPATIERLGNKVEARKIARQVGAPLVEGTAEPVSDLAEVLAFVKQHGLPIAIKAAYGGGGRGMKVVWRLDEVAELFESATREALTAFGNGDCFLEQFLHQPRHVEAQVLADKYGNVTVLGTRDCSLQRRNQKLVEEAPAPFLTETQRETLHKAAYDICLAADYVGAGTVEFLLSSDGKLSFLEVNTRLQVEHTVTEQTLGMDLVIEQFRIADGHALNIGKPPVPYCHAMEFRINAEDPGCGFMPTPGTITLFQPPTGIGVRIDSGVESGSIVPRSFDSMMAKLIVTGATRHEVIARARRAFKEFNIEGVASTLPFFNAVLQHPDFVADNGFNVHTRWIETDFANNIAIAPRSASTPDKVMHRTIIEIDGKRYKLGLPFELLSRAVAPEGKMPSQPVAPQETLNDVNAPVSGNLQAWLVADGVEVSEGQAIAVMEAMKMEIHINAPLSGKIVFKADVNTFLSEGTQIARID